MADEGGDPLSEVPGSVTYYPGNGNGTFGTPVTLTSQDYPQYVAAADLNQDGNLDIVAVTTDDSFLSTVYTFLGDGKGDFEATQTLPLNTLANGLAVGDLNGDGFPDMVVPECCGQSYAALFTGNGDGTFGNETTLPVLPAPTTALLADLTGDNKLDLLLGFNQVGIDAFVNISNSAIPPRYRLPQVLRLLLARPAPPQRPPRHRPSPRPQLRARRLHRAQLLLSHRPQLRRPHGPQWLPARPLPHLRQCQ